MDGVGHQPWSPRPGAAIERLRSRNGSLAAEEWEHVLSASTRTLSRCADPAQTGRQTNAHIVVGEVQSGKTLAFTTLMALARDNGFRFVVVLAGTKVGLLEQTVERLRTDLLSGDGGRNPWRRLVNPSDADERELLQALRPGGDATLVCFVLKQASRLRSLARLLESAGRHVDLCAVPALIVDDEADQASPNRRVRKGEESAIYAAVREVRSALPRHDFIMYTATPQAPLLIELSDHLSPSTVTVLRSGAAYVGGATLLQERRSEYVRQISRADEAVVTDPGAVEPPSSLRLAVATFLLALVVAQERGSPRPLSMLVHPAASRDVHEKHVRWVERIVDDILLPLRDPSDVAFAEALRGVLATAYRDLATTVSDLPPLEALAEAVPAYAESVKVAKVNQDAEREIHPDDWDDHAGWIVVGGAKLDRGFTVKNLAITYMPRGRGVGNADTIQQRGRFFGYKRDYLDLCRGWLSDETADALTSYVAHERALTASLRSFERTGHPLSRWKRFFMLSTDLKPTRREVISKNTTVLGIMSEGGWIEQRHLDDEAKGQRNQEQLRQFVSSIGADVFARDERDGRSGSRAHETAATTVSRVIELLADWAKREQDVERVDGAAMALSLLDGDMSMNVIAADGIDPATGVPRVRLRRRTARRSSNSLMQGPSAGFPSDRAFTTEDSPTLMLFVYDVASGLTTQPAIALHIPRAIGGPIVVYDPS